MNKNIYILGCNYVISMTLCNKDNHNESVIPSHLICLL